MNSKFRINNLHYEPVQEWIIWFNKAKKALVSGRRTRQQKCLRVLIFIEYPNTFTVIQFLFMNSYQSLCCGVIHIRHRFVLS